MGDDRCHGCPDPGVDPDLPAAAADRPRAGALAGARRGKVRVRGRFAYIDGALDSGEVLDNGEVLALCRLRYVGSATVWGFAIYLASKDGYQDSLLPSGRPSGTPQEALDCACGLYRADPSAWSQQRP
jgi:hypothetical protein